MRLSLTPPSLLSLIAVLLSSSSLIQAKPVPGLAAIIARGNLEIRDTCAYPCGAVAICCPGPNQCYTDSQNKAACSTAYTATTTAAAGYAGAAWSTYVTTIVQTDLVTRVSTVVSCISGCSQVAPAAATTVYIPASTSAVATAVAIACNNAYGQIPCGTLCCASWQSCAYSGQCAGGSGGGFSSVYFNSMNPVTSSATYVAPLKPTGTTSATTTVAFIAPSAATSGIVYPVAQTSNSGLSGGAIAGIVIGVIIGVFLLFLLCAGYCAKELFHPILAIFGLGRRRGRREETIIAGRHSHHSGRYSGGGSAHGASGWFGAGRPSRPPPKKSSGLGGLATIGASLAGLWVILGLKRRFERSEKSEYSGSSESSESSTEAPQTGLDPHTTPIRGGSSLKSILRFLLD
ncbi:MAG: hypothetical protein M1829_004044 [Trizodia sp. TS-e1964]|nr:MAG: hypothetical protein M1829_004044 [Trizodia sp. TS-e1964]